MSYLFLLSVYVSDSGSLLSFSGLERWRMGNRFVEFRCKNARCESFEVQDLSFGSSQVIESGSGSVRIP